MAAPCGPRAGEGKVVRTQLWLLLYEVAKSIVVLCSGRKGSCCWGWESHPAGCAAWK